MKINPVGGALGAEVSGVELGNLSDEEFVAIEQAWLEHMVLFFRDQAMTPEQHIAFATHFGEAQKPGFVPTLPDYPEVRRQEYDESSKIGSDVTWHADDTFLELPSKGSVLYALDVPDFGGDTVWVNAAKAYEQLSASMRDFLDSLTAVHDLVATMGPGVLKQYGVERFKAFMDSTPPVEHPVVRVHPDTQRRSLFVNPLMTSHIKDMSEAESDALLGFLYQNLQAPELQCRFRWRKHSVAFWDNRSTLHKGINDFWPAHRLMHRVAIADAMRPEPVAAAA